MLVYLEVIAAVLRRLVVAGDQLTVKMAIRHCPIPEAIFCAFILLV